MYIQIHHFTKELKDIVVLNNIHLSLEKNKIYGFVGTNGSGKTMLLRAIAGLLNPTDGYIMVDNVLVGNGVHPKSVGILIENADLWPELSAYENLKILNAMSEHQLQEQEIKGLLSEFGLDPDDKKCFKAFSLGMKQKLRIAQAFMGEPDLLILDEPTNALDERSISHLRDFILGQKDKGKTILLASHASAEIDALCDEIIFMDAGKVIQQKKVL